MNINAAFPSKYLKSSEVPEDGIAVTIARIEIEDVDGKGARKPVLYFQKATKGMALNVTNSKKIASIIGTAETDDWPGHKIVLYQSETDYQGETVACIRVRAPKKSNQPQAAPPPPPPPPAEELTDEDIPF